MNVERDVHLAPRTTLEVGGPARFFVEVRSEGEVRQALDWAAEEEARVEVLGGGSNVLVADRGLDALVIRVRGEAIADRGEGVVDVQAGLRWDDLVAWAVERGLTGLECLSGIPGDVGAAPMQNVGAYGQEVGETIARVVAISRQTGERRVFDAEACGFGYRDSVFKRDQAGKWIVTEVRFRLRPGQGPTIRYAELERAVRDQGDLTLASVRRTVIALRRSKSMVLDPRDDNRRSAGSFFVNPVLTDTELDLAEARVDETLGPNVTMPRFPAAGGTKVPAAWLIERAGLGKGTARGRVGLSTKHCLAIVNRGGATAQQLVDFAAEVRATVRDRFGVTLTPEPRLLGFAPEETAALFD